MIDVDGEELTRRWTYRTNYYKNIVREQFELAYFGRVDFISSSEMPVSERKLMHSLLVDQKTAEKEAQEKALESKKGKKKR